MSLDELKSGYFLADGDILGFDFDYATKTLKLKFEGTKGVHQKKYEKSVAVFQFRGVKVIDIFEDFPTDGGCSDVTLVKLENSDFYLSLDPYGNTGVPHEEDNWIIKAESLTFIGEDGMSHSIT